MAKAPLLNLNNALLQGGEGIICSYNRCCCDYADQ